jgi:metallo-beta-lactamase family protein
MVSPTLRLTFLGAAGQVTGSMHMLEAAGMKLVLDAGLFQGKRKESDALNRNLPFDPRVLDAVVLSHAHIDHTGRVPLLVNHGFHGPIYATPATRDLCAVMLADSANIQESDFEHLKRHDRAGPEAEPLYTMRDAVAAQELMVGVPYKRIQHLRKHLTIEYVDAGHILGSASVDVRITEGKQPYRLVFSGDIGRTGMPIIRNPDPPTGPIDALIIESTYALKTHAAPADAENNLAQIISKVVGRGGKILIPSFAVGRTQEMVYAIHELLRAKKIPQVPVYIDSPLATETTTVFRMHPEIFDKTEEMVKTESPLFDHQLVTYTRSVEDSKRLNTLQGPAIIISASGMVEAGRILHHIKNHGGDHRNCILFVGFQAEHTLGRRIKDGDRKVRIYGDEVELRAEVEVIDGYSAHAGRNELIAWIKALGGPIKRAFAVHGEPESLAEMANLLTQAGVSEVHVPAQGQSFDL